MDDFQILRNADMMVRRSRRRRRRRQGIGAESQMIAVQIKFMKQKGKERKTSENKIEEVRVACEAKGRASNTDKRILAAVRMWITLEK